MFVEGRGWIAPAPKIVSIDDGQLKTLSLLGQRRANFRGYQRRKDSWGKGFNVDATFLGLVGEAALANYVNAHVGYQALNVDTVQRAHGDPGYDFKIGGLTIDTKASRTNGRPLLVRRIDDFKNIVPLRADAYVLVDAHDVAQPQLVGWVRKEKMIKLARSPRGDAKHWNLLVLRDRLLPIDRLLDAIESELLKGVA